MSARIALGKMSIVTHLANEVTSAGRVSLRVLATARAIEEARAGQRTLVVERKAKAEMELVAKATGRRTVEIVMVGQGAKPPGSLAHPIVMFVEAPMTETTSAVDDGKPCR